MHTHTQTHTIILHNSLNYSRHSSRQCFVFWICRFGTPAQSSHPGSCHLFISGWLGRHPVKLSSFSIISGMMVLQLLFRSFLFSLLSVPLSLMSPTACSRIKKKCIVPQEKMLCSTFYSRHFNAHNVGKEAWEYLCHGEMLIKPFVTFRYRMYWFVTVCIHHNIKSLSTISTSYCNTLVPVILVLIY